jgi:hypothetical protein
MTKHVAGATLPGIRSICAISRLTEHPMIVRYHRKRRPRFTAMPIDQYYFTIAADELGWQQLLAWSLWRRSGDSVSAPFGDGWR